jgi:hypothetical protein
MVEATLSEEPNVLAIPLYQYTPLFGSDSIRILSLLPRMQGNDIKVRIHHKKVSSLRICETLSYEWGEPTRTKHIFCENRVLMVTTNLLAALKRLRQPRKERLLWIDAVCINQEDLKERLQQVALMSAIYKSAKQTILWIGEEKSNTQEAFNIMPILAQALQKFGDPSRLADYLSQVKDRSVLRFIDKIRQLLTESACTGLLDLFSRPYFGRLWIMQEICLSSKASILCGTHSLDWNTFYMAARLTYECEFVNKGRSVSAIGRINTLKALQVAVVHGRQNLGHIILGGSTFCATDPRDHVFAILGMLKESDQRYMLDRITYEDSPEYIFMIATKWIIHTDQDLSIWNMLTLSLDVRCALHSDPSWVQSSTKFLESLMFLVPNDNYMRAKMGLESDDVHQIAIESSTVYIHGHILDSITYVSQNFSDSTMKDAILQAYDDLKPSAVYESLPVALTALWKALRLFEPGRGDNEEIMEQEFKTCISHWQLEKLGLSPDVLAKNPTLAELSKKHPQLQLKYPSQTADGMTVQELYSSDLKISSYFFNASKRESGVPDDEYRFCNYHHPVSLGRNLFIGSQGYIGVGPAGYIHTNSPQIPAVQVGDFIAIIAKAYTPLILRPRNDSSYAIVGVAYIGSFFDTPFFDRIDNLDFLPFKIR